MIRTLSDLTAEDTATWKRTLYVKCERFDGPCGGFLTITAAEVREKLGRDATLPELRRIFKCKECGGPAKIDWDLPPFRMGMGQS